MKKILLHIFLFGFGVFHSQGVLEYHSENFTSLQPRKIYSITDGMNYNIKENFGHPDFGILPYNSPIGKNVVEQLHKRTETERYYVDLNDKTFFYIQKSINPINYFKNGYWLAVDPTLEKTGENLYQAPKQPYPTKFDFNKGYYAIDYDGGILQSGNYKLITLSNSNSITTYSANISNYAVGNNGALVYDIFPGVDLKLIALQGGIKSNFIIKTPFSNTKKIIICDSLLLNNGLSLSQQSGFPGQLFIDGINVNDMNLNTKFIISKAYTFDASGNRNNFTFNQYRLNGNVLELHLDSSYINSNQTIYPLTIDPLITAVGPVAAPANAIGSLLTPAFCSQVLTVTYPGGSTPWDFTTTWQTASNGCCTSGPPGPAVTCFNSDPRIEILSNCGGKSPAGAGLYWSCPGCNTPGTWGPTIPYSGSGSQSLIQCLPASCSNQNITFTLNLLRVFCSDNNGCTCTYATNTCVRLNSWNVTLQGRTLENLNETTTGNGTTTINVVCFNSTTLNPSSLYGVTPYTYLWAPGGQTTPTINYTANMIGSTTYTVTVTDACGTVKTAIFTVNNNCVLPVTLKKFEAIYNGTTVDLFWETASELNADYFLIEKSIDGIEFSTVAKVKAAGKSSTNKTYTTPDTKPSIGAVAYYRIKQFDLNRDEVAYQHIITLAIQNDLFEMNLVPNPTNKQFNLVLKGLAKNENLQISIFDYTGKLVAEKNIQPKDENTKELFMLDNLKSGIYNVTIKRNNQLYHQKLIIN